jgi:hypothetical protein
MSLAAELLALYPVIYFARSEKRGPPAACLYAVQTHVSTTPLTCEPNLRTTLGPSGLLRGQSLTTTTKIHRQHDVSPNSHARHNPRNNQRPALPRWPGGGLLYSLSPRDIAFSEGFERIPTHITLMDVVNRPLLTKESADNAMGVSAPVVLRLPPGRVHN